MFYLNVNNYLHETKCLYIYHYRISISFVLYILSVVMQVIEWQAIQEKRPRDKKNLIIALQPESKLHKSRVLSF